MSKETQIVKGQLLATDELDSAYRVRGLEYRNDVLPPGSEIPEGWELEKALKTKIRIRKKKSVATMLEDKIWRLLFDIGVEQISDGIFTLKLKERNGVVKTKQIDVVGIDTDTVFIIECKSREELGRKSLKAEIAEFAGNMADFRAAFRALLDNRDLEFVFVMATENIVWSEVDRHDASDAGIQIWDEYDTLALQELAKLAGHGAKYQIYGKIFHDRKVKGFDVKVAALEARMGGKVYYTFVMTPEDLLKIAYVHHRTGQSGFMEVSDSYQRIIKTTRLRSVERFIKEGGSFPGNLILNFHKPLKDVQPLGTIDVRSSLSGKARPVVITLPPYYGSAWIIDGQHRLYGYADLDEKHSETIPVVAFVEQDVSFESQVFVDVNKNQKAIEKALLWDLYEDLYPSSTKENEKLLFSISRIAKHLATSKDSPFFEQIRIPKEQKERGNLTLTTVCDTLFNQKIVTPKEELLFRDNWEDTFEFAVARIKLFFQVIKDEMPDEWGLGDNHYVRTNAAFVVFLGLLRDCVECNLAPGEIKDLSKFRATIAKFLEPVLIHLMDATREQIKEYRGAGGALQKSRQIRAQFVKLIQQSNPGFRSIMVEQLEEADRRETTLASRNLIDFLEEDESERLEFKGSLVTNLNALLLAGKDCGEDQSVLNEGVLKGIVGLLNTYGGDLLVGILEKNRFASVYDEKLANYPIVGNNIVYGIRHEYGKDEWDVYERRLMDWIDSRIGSDVLLEELVKIRKLRMKGHDVCLVSIKPSPTKQYLQGSKFYRRVGNKTIELHGPEIDKFWKARNKKL